MLHHWDWGINLIQIVPRLNLNWIVSKGVNLSTQRPLVHDLSFELHGPSNY